MLGNKKRKVSLVGDALSGYIHILTNPLDQAFGLMRGEYSLMVQETGVQF